MNIVGFEIQKQKVDKEVSDILDSMNIRNESTTFVINHPPTFLETLDSKGVDLMFSGHTHRGQFWPLRYITKSIYGKYYYGHNKFKNLQTITTSGVGTAGPPIKLFNTPEIMEIKFISK
ncbi:MAG: hypothetical protein R3B65_02550 [Candidatus Paceibacterota bacterium]